MLHLVNCDCFNLKIRGAKLSNGKQVYPKMLYHWDRTSQQLVHNRDQEATLGPEWFDSPTKAQDEQNRRFDAIKNPSELSVYAAKPELINRYFKRRVQQAEREQKWIAIREYNMYFPELVIQFKWAGRFLKNLPPEIPTANDRPKPIVWLGTARAWGDMVIKAYNEHLIKASSALNALQQAAEHYVRQQPGKPSKPFNPRAVWQSLKNRQDYQDPTKPGPR